MQRHCIFFLNLDPRRFAGVFEALNALISHHTAPHERYAGRERSS